MAVGEPSAEGDMASSRGLGRAGRVPGRRQGFSSPVRPVRRQSASPCPSIVRGPEAHREDVARGGQLGRREQACALLVIEGQGPDSWGWGSKEGTGLHRLP